MRGPHITPYQFKAYRILAGLGMAFFWARQAYTSQFEVPFWQDFFPRVEWESLIGFFPNVLALGPLEVPLALLGLVSSLFVCLGVARRFFASVGLYALACVHHSELMALTPFSVMMAYLSVQLMLAPEKALNQPWRLRRWHSLAAGVLLLFHLVLVVNPFILPTRLLTEAQVLTPHFPLWLHAVFSLSFLMLAHKPWRAPFWGVQLVMVMSLMLIGMDMASLFLLLALLILSIDPRWLLPQEPPELVVFYDGNCGLCHGFVRFLLDVDESEVTKFAALQSPLAQEKLAAHPELINDLETVVVLNEGELTVRSRAAFEIFRYLGGPWAILSCLRFLPTPLTDFFYRLVAKRRYQIFGRYESCPLPSPEEKQRFLSGG